MGRSSTSYRQGADPRRHQFTAEERRRGYASAMARAPQAVAGWLWRRVRGYYRATAETGEHRAALALAERRRKAARRREQARRRKAAG